MDTTEHPFAHLGAPPYKFVGLETTEDREMMHAARRAAGLMYTTNMCGGSCDHCGTAIANVYWFMSADGKRFKVGCDCAEKAHIKNKSAPPYLVEARRAKRDRDRELRHAREARKLVEAVAWFDGHMADLAKLPHPLEWAAAQGKSAADWAAWTLANAGTTGKLKALKQAKLMLEERR